MTVFYVATLARYVLVDAANEDEARERGTIALHDLYADVRAKLGRDVPIDIRTVRLATSDEIDLWQWHNRMIDAERKTLAGSLRPGDRVRLEAMQADPDPISVGETGTVVSCHRHITGGKEWFQIDVVWDNGRTLMLVCPPDEFEIIERAKFDHS